MDIPLPLRLLVVPKTMIRKTKHIHLIQGPVNAMKKKRVELQEQQEHHDLEVLKAVAQAWYSHSGTSKPISEFEAHRRNFRVKPSRFKLEACTTNPSTTCTAITTPTPYWDFQHSLWDSYELVTVSRRIETGLAFDNPFDDLCVSTLQLQPKRKPESKNSLRNLFNFMSSRRFNASKIPLENDNT
ncbi:hypothetical protein RJT34_33252 [Clitoria ternatea]|uniref:Uncharacterized protein n=1 Tax=Clitoria ternatea TaxID=43366 RepID=A0AAN9I6N0_CLITE